MIILEKEKVTVNPDIKVIKRDGRMVLLIQVKYMKLFSKQAKLLHLSHH